MQDIEKFYAQNDGLFLGAFLQNQLVGTIAYLNIGYHSIALRKMFVKKEYRGAQYKVAQSLLETLENYAGENKIKTIFLGTVSIMKAAHRFYEKNQYTKINKEHLPNYFPLMQVDNLFYKKNI